MTQAELDALPEVRGVVLYQPAHEDVMYVVDAQGERWSVGIYQGQRAKSPHGKPCWFGMTVRSDGVRVPVPYIGFQHEMLPRSPVGDEAQGS